MSKIPYDCAAVLVTMRAANSRDPPQTRVAGVFGSRAQAIQAYECMQAPPALMLKAAHTFHWQSGWQGVREQILCDDFAPWETYEDSLQNVRMAIAEATSIFCDHCLYGYPLGVEPWTLASSLFDAGVLLNLALLKRLPLKPFEGTANAEQNRMSWRPPT